MSKPDSPIDIDEGRYRDATDNSYAPPRPASDEICRLIEIHNIDTDRGTIDLSVIPPSELIDIDFCGEYHLMPADIFVERYLERVAIDPSTRHTNYTWMFNVNDGPGQKPKHRHYHYGLPTGGGTYGESEFRKKLGKVVPPQSSLSEGWVTRPTRDREGDDWKRFMNRMIEERGEVEYVTSGRFRDTDGVNTKLRGRILETFDGDHERVRRARPSELQRVDRIGPVLAERIAATMPDEPIELDRVVRALPDCPPVVEPTPEYAPLC